MNANGPRTNGMAPPSDERDKSIGRVGCGIKTPQNTDSGDRELLELAAKACGNGAQWDGPERGMMVLTPIGFDTMTWNPLTDDGDALRLAVALHMSVVVTPNNGPSARTACGPWADEDASEDMGAATRRAIVRAAAEIGRAM